MGSLLPELLAEGLKGRTQVLAQSVPNPSVNSYLPLHILPRQNWLAFLAQRVKASGTVSTHTTLNQSRDVTLAGP